MSYRPSAERTRSRSWRSGTRRNKKHPVAHLPVHVCPRVDLCLVHCPDPDATLAARIVSRRPALAMRLTSCEQKWVDDVRARKPHTHTKAWHRKHRVAALRIMVKHVWKGNDRLGKAIFGVDFGVRGVGGTIAVAVSGVDSAVRGAMRQEIEQSTMQIGRAAYRGRY